MGKVLTLWGSPGSGVTTLAVKAALALYERNTTVLVLHTDRQTPVLPVLFPHNKSEDEASIGEALSGTSITRESVLRCIVTDRRKPDLGFLGYAFGENRFSYPAFGKEKAQSLLNRLTSLADYVVVDAGSVPDDPLAAAAMELSSYVLRVASPSLKSFSFFASQPTEANSLTILNCPVPGRCLPVAEAHRHFRAKTVLPYCSELFEQMQEGTLLQPIRQKDFNRAFQSVAARVVGG